MKEASVAEAMTDEEYLQAKGWTPRVSGWDPPPRPSDGPTMDVYPVPWPTAKAVERQLAEDRAVLAFVLSRSAPSIQCPGSRVRVDAAGGAYACPSCSMKWGAHPGPNGYEAAEIPDHVLTPPAPSATVDR